MRAALIELCCLWSAIALQAQVLPDLRPPAQTYIYNFDGTSAVAPVAPALNLGATFSLEFWIMRERDSVDQEYMRVFQKEAGLQLDIDPGTHELSYFQVTAEPTAIAALVSRRKTPSSSRKPTACSRWYTSESHHQFDKRSPKKMPRPWLTAAPQEGVARYAPTGAPRIGMMVGLTTRDPFRCE